MLLLYFLPLLPFLPSSLAAPPGKVNTFIVPGDDTYPEAVTSQPHTQNFYTVSTRDGTVFRGTLSSPTVSPFINGAEAGNMTSGIGIKYFRDHLVIAGGYTATVFVFSIKSKKLVARFRTGLDPAVGTSFLNDFALDEKTGDTWISDSSFPAIWKIPGDRLLGGRRGRGNDHDDDEKWDPLEQKLELAVDLKGKAPFNAPFNGNGMVLLPGKEYLVWGNTGERAVYRISLKSGEAKKIAIAEDIGAPDGVLYSDRYNTLYIVNGAHSEEDPGDYITAIELKKPYTTGRVIRRVTNPLLDFASTADFVEGTKEKEVLAVNFQGTRQLSGTPVLPFKIVRIPVV